MILEEFSAWFVWVLPLIASLFVPIIGKYSDKARNYFVVAIAAVTAVLALSLVPSVWNGNGVATEFSVSWIPGLNGPLNAGVYIDPLSVLFTCLVAFFALIIAIYSIGYMKGEEGLTRYYYLILLFIGSMIGLVIADNMLQMFIFWEMVGLCSYALISFWYKKPESIKAGVKVFIMTRIGDICLACRYRYPLFNVWHLQLPWSNNRYTRCCNGRDIEYKSTGCCCIPCFRRRYCKVCSASIVHLVI